MAYDEFRRPLAARVDPDEVATRRLKVIAEALREARGPHVQREALRQPAERLADVCAAMRLDERTPTVLFADGVATVNQEVARLSYDASEVVGELCHHCLLRGLGGFALRGPVSVDDALALLEAWRAEMPSGGRKQRYARSVEELNSRRHARQLKGASPLAYVPVTQVKDLLAERSVVLPPSARKATLCAARLFARTRQALQTIARQDLDKVEKERAEQRAVFAIQRVIQEIIDEVDTDVFRSRLLAWTYLRGVELQIVHHNVSKAIFVICAGRELGLEPVRVAGLAMAAVLHDTITAGAPAGHQLWAESGRCALRSPDFSRDVLYRLVLPYEQLSLHVLDLDPLGGEPPLFESHLLAVSCAFDRLTRDEWMPPSQALREVAADRSFHRAASAALVAALGALPRGTVVRLTDGDLGVVIENGRHRLHRPLVRRLQRGDGQRILDRHFVELLDPNAPRIEGTIDERNLGLDVMEAVIEGTSNELDDIAG